MKDQPYTNRFEDVYRKVGDFKDRAREAKNGDTQLREKRLAQDAKEMLAKEHSSRS